MSLLVITITQIYDA